MFVFRAVGGEVSCKQYYSNNGNTEVVNILTTNHGDSWDLSTNTGTTDYTKYYHGNLPSYTIYFNGLTNGTEPANYYYDINEVLWGAVTEDDVLERVNKIKWVLS